MSDFPLVDVNDDGIRPAGRPDACFYCGRKVGEIHKKDCAVVTKIVKVKYTVELELEFPHFYTKEDVEFNRNDGTWCATNIIEELKRQDEKDGCLCNRVSCEFVEVVDPTPNRKIVMRERNQSR